MTVSHPLDAPAGPARTRARSGRPVNGATVRALRLARELHQEDLAQQADLSAGYLSKIERSWRRVEPDKAAKLATALRVPVDVLTGQLPVIGVLRDALQLAPDQFARAVGVTLARLDRLEQGSELPDPELVEVIANRLGVPPAALATSLDRATS